MKYYELNAQRTGSQIIERFFDNGKRFIKYIPFNPKVFVALKEQFKDKPILVEMRGSWIVITKTAKDPLMEKAGASILKEGEVLTVERLAEEEMKMLKSAGFKVTYVVGDTDEA